MSSSSVLRDTIVLFVSHCVEKFAVALRFRITVVCQFVLVLENFLTRTAVCQLSKKVDSLNSKYSSRCQKQCVLILKLFGKVGSEGKLPHSRVHKLMATTKLVMTFWKYVDKTIRRCGW